MISFFAQADCEALRVLEGERGSLARARAGGVHGVSSGDRASAAPVTDSVEVVNRVGTEIAVMAVEDLRQRIRVVLVQIAQPDEPLSLRRVAERAAGRFGRS